MSPLGIGLVTAGGLSLLISHLAERYHSNRFSAHVDELDAAAERDDDEAIREEIEEFHSDRRVDVSIEAMFWLQTLGVLALALGLFLLLA